MSEAEKCLFEEHEKDLVINEGELYWPTNETHSFYYKRWGRQMYVFMKEDKTIIHRPDSLCAVNDDLMGTEPHVLMNFPCFRCQKRISFVPRTVEQNGEESLKTRPE